MEPNDYHVHKATCWAGWLWREDNWAKTEGKECYVTSYIKLWFISHPTQMANPHVQSPQSHFLADNPNRAACASASTLEIDGIDSLLGGWCMLKSAKLGPEKLLVVLDEWAIVRPFQFCSQEPLEIIDKVHIKRSHRLQEGRYCIVDMLFSRSHIRHLILILITFFFSQILKFNLPSLYPWGILLGMLA